MFAKLRALFESSLNQGATSEDLEQQLQLASAVLLLEVARTDQHIDPVELDSIRDAIQSSFSLNDEATQALMTDADVQVAEAIDFHQFTSILNQRFDVGQKCRLVEYMWRVALVDGNLDGYEDQFIRKISDLLYLRHTELISARERAKASIS